MAGGKQGAAAKEAKAAAKKEKREQSRARRRQMWQMFQTQRKEDKLLLPLMVGSVLLAAALAFVIGLFFGLEWPLLPVGIALGVMGAGATSCRPVRGSVYSDADGTLRAAR